MEPYRSRLQCAENVVTKLFPSVLFFLYIAVILGGAWLIPYVVTGPGRTSVLDLAHKPVAVASGIGVAVFIILFINTAFLSQFNSVART